MVDNDSWSKESEGESHEKTETSLTVGLKVRQLNSGTGEKGNFARGSQIERRGRSQRKHKTGRRKKDHSGETCPQSGPNSTVKNEAPVRGPHGPKTEREKLTGACHRGSSNERDGGKGTRQSQEQGSVKK